MSEWRKVVKRALKWSAVAAVVAAAAGWQIRIRPQLLIGPDQAADTPDAKDAPEGVYVPESELAMERLNLAQKMERLKEWNKSADLYQEVLTDPKYATKVVPAEGETDHRLFRSVEELVMQRLSHWPGEGLDVYRARYETPASTLLQSAKVDEVSALHQVFSRYFVTDSGKTAGIRLIDRYLETGEFRAAAAIAEKLLQWHPNLGADRPLILYRASIAFHLSGDDREARGYLAELKKHDAQVKGMVRGAEVVLADSLGKELDQPAPLAAGASADSYTTFGGDPSRNRVVGVSGTPGAHLYSILLPRVRPGNTPQAAAAEAKYKEQVKSGLNLGIMPVIDRGQLFFQDGSRIYAVDLESGVPLAEWVKNNGPDHGGAFKVAGLAESSRLRQLTLTVTDRNIIAVMGEQDPNLASAVIQRAGETRLVCINRQSGKQNWLVQPARLKQESLRTLQLGGSPLMVGDNVLLVATAVKQAGFEDCYVLCFALEDGALRWATNIASSSTLSQPMGMPFNTGFYLAPNNSHLAYANGRVFVQTNRGAVASVDVYNGMIGWLATYDRGQQAINAGFNPMMLQQRDPQNQPKPWSYNPVIVSQGLVFTLPMEGKNLLIYQAEGGRLVKQINLDDLGQRLRSDDIEPLKFDTLVGVYGDMLVLAASKSVVALNWKTYDAPRYDDRKMLFWEEGYPHEIRGRPFLSQNQLYLATQERMFMVNLKTGFAETDYPQYPRTWGDDEGPGNLLVTSDHVVIAGAEHVDVYTDLAAAKTKLDREVAQSPSDPQPRLRYAEVTYAAGDYATSIAKLDEAIDRAGGQNLRPGEIRDRIFNDALTFAQKLKADVTPDGRQRVETLFDRAGQAASSPQQQVSYRMARASFDQLKDDLAGAVELYQGILSEPQWRSVSLADESSPAAPGAVSADVRARDEIARLMRRDSSVYAKFETQAADLLQKAQEASDPAKLLAVAQTYPNSSIAPKATLAAAKAYEDSGQPRLARRVLLDMYFDREGKTQQRAQIVEALARTNLVAAGPLLAEGAAELNDPKLQQPLKLADGTELPAGSSFSSVAAAAKKHPSESAAAMLPTLRLPNPPADDSPYPKPFVAKPSVIDNVDALVMPIEGHARPDRIVTWSAQPELDVYAPGSQTPLASNKQITQRPLGGAWSGDDLFVWSQNQLLMLRENGSAVAWKLELSSLPAVEVLTPDEASDDAIADANNAMLQQRALIVARQQAMMARGIRRGVLIPAPPPPADVPAPVGPEQIDRVLPAADHLVFSTTTGRVVSLDTSSGNVAWQVRFSERAVTRLVANEDFTVVLPESNAGVRLEVLDTSNGHVRASRFFARSSESFPQNIALSPDGTLVYTLQKSICLKNLYKPDKSWSQRSIEHPLPSPANFTGLSSPEQLVIVGRRILAVSDSGGGNRSGEKYVHVYSLDTGAPTMVQVGPKQQVEQALSAATKSPDVRLRVAGSRLFTVASDACNAYELNQPDQTATLYNPQYDPPPVISQSLLGSDFAVFIGGDSEQAQDAVPAKAAPPSSPTSLQLFAYERARTAHGETNRLDYQLKLDDAGGLTKEWQPFDGGICYRSADRKLHLLMGAGR